MAYDSNRTAYLSRLGITVIRFTNRNIKNNFEAVCTAIDLKLKELLK